MIKYTFFQSMSRRSYSSSPSRLPYEFDDSIKDQVYERSDGMCEECGKRPGVQYHHIISVAYGRDFGYDPREIKSAENCMYVCGECHFILDEYSRL